MVRKQNKGSAIVCSNNSNEKMSECPRTKQEKLSGQNFKIELQREAYERKRSLGYWRQERGSLGARHS